MVDQSIVHPELSSQVRDLTVNENENKNLNAEVLDNKIEIENYSFIRKNRDQKQGKKWGGVLIYFESHINIPKINYNFELGITEANLIEAVL